MREQAPSTPDKAAKRRRIAFPDVALWLALFASAGVSLIELFRYPLYDRLWIIFSPYMETGISLLFVAASVLALAALFFARKHGFRAAYPAALCACTFLLTFFVPLSDLWLWANFHWYKSAREAIVRQVDTGVLRPNVNGSDSLITLSPDTPRVSGDDNRIAIERIGGKTYATFFVYSHVLDNWAGFLYVPPGGDLKRSYFAHEERQVETIEWVPHWYFVRPWR